VAYIPWRNGVMMMEDDKGEGMGRFEVLPLCKLQF
jgi:hypothetical protein